MRTLLGLVILGLAMLITLAEMESLAHPAAAAMANDGAPHAPGEPWYVHVLWAIVILLLATVSVRLLSGGILGRLVRGRGFTPAER